MVIYCDKCGARVLEEHTYDGDVDRVCVMGHTYITEAERKSAAAFLIRRQAITRIRPASHNGMSMGGNKK
jgi:sarcosine oxidase delta subunit